MWIVIKYKKNNSQILINELKKIFQNKIEYYLPKMKIDQTIKKKNKQKVFFITNNYMFCNISKFNKIEILLERLKFVKGVNYILDFFKCSQREIEAFINKCKMHEDKYGNIKSSFFQVIEKSKIKFLNGPLLNKIISIEKNKKNFLKSSINNINISINKSNILFETVS